MCLYRVAVEVVSTKTTADVMWKDGRVEKGIRSNDLIPIQHLDSHEFCPGDFVVDKRRKENLLNYIFFLYDDFCCFISLSVISLLKCPLSL